MNRMKKMNKLFAGLIFCFTFCLSACSQNESIDHSSLVVKSVEKLLDQNLAGHQYIVFSLADTKFIIIVKNGNQYDEFYLVKKTKDEIPKLVSKVTKNQDDLFEKMFNKNIYEKEFVTFDSDFYKPNGYELSSGNLTYFVFKDKERKKYGEAKLSFFIKPNPIDTEIYGYFISQISYYNDNDN